MEYDAVLKRLRAMSDKYWAESNKRLGINSGNMLGISMPRLRALAKEIGTDQGLSLRLWNSGVHEAMALATLVGDPERVTALQLERWVKDLDSWSICDAACGNLFWRTKPALKKVNGWSARKPEYEKRAAFSLMACIAVHRKDLDDGVFLRFLPLIVRESNDDRNFVKKAANWALREIGKRNKRLNKAAITTAKELKDSDSRGARWIGSDAYRELSGKRCKKALLTAERHFRLCLPSASVGI